MSVLTNAAIWDQIKKPADPLVITPLLEKEQIGASSVDVRIGHQFIVLQRPAVTHVDPTQVNHPKMSIYQTQHRIRVSLHEEFVIHPGQLVLGATLEYIAVPKDLAATVEGRSSWGRLGLIIATACSVAPGFKGCITLELLNQGEVPLVLYPGIRIAQLIFSRTEGKADYREKDDPPKYDCPTGPQFSQIHHDTEMPIWGNQTPAATGAGSGAVKNGS
jgi:dCTP deaminase